MTDATQRRFCEAQHSDDSGSCLAVHRTILKFLRNCGKTRRASGVDVVGKKEGAGGFCRRSESTDHPSSQSGGGMFKDQSSMWSLTTASSVLGTRVDEDLTVDGITMGKTLGRGHFGSVYQAFLNGKVWAIKIIKQEDTAEVSPAAEMLLQGIAHPNLVQIYGVKERQGYQHVDNEAGEARISFATTERDSVDSWCRSSASSDFLAYLTKAGEGKETWVFMEYCDLGSLWDAVHRGDFNSMPKMQKPCWVRITAVALEVARALAHLHSVGIMHGDLKPQNVLLKTCENSAKGFVAKVGDFGLSRQNVGKTHLSIVCHGTVDHMPPEVLKDSHMSAACDVFSFGMLLWEIIAGQKPFKGLQQAAIVVAIVEGHRPFLSPSIPKPLSDLIQDCWQQDPRGRPSFSTIVQRLEDLALLATKWERNMILPVVSPKKTGMKVPPTDCAHSERYMRRKSEMLADGRLTWSFHCDPPYEISKKNCDCNLE